MTKKCKACSIELPSSEFHKTPGNKDGLAGKCKGCTKLARMGVDKPKTKKQEPKTPKKAPTQEGGKGRKPFTGKMEPLPVEVKEPERPNYRTIFSRTKAGAKKRGKFFDLNYEDFAQVAGENCIYCGSEPSNEFDGVKYQGLDRINPKGGYTEDNILPCCSWCNTMRGAMPIGPWVYWIYLLRGKSEGSPLPKVLIPLMDSGTTFRKRKPPWRGR